MLRTASPTASPRPGGVGFPCVVKPLALSGSRGVIRADDRASFAVAFARTGRLLGDPAVRRLDPEAADRILVESFVPGREFALEGLLRGGPSTSSPCTTSPILWTVRTSRKLSTSPPRGCHPSTSAASSARPPPRPARSASPRGRFTRSSGSVPMVQSSSRLPPGRSGACARAASASRGASPSRMWSCATRSASRRDPNAIRDPRAS